VSQLLHPLLSGHVDGLVPERHPRLREMEARAGRDRFPIIGPAAGHFCYLVTRMIGARTVFEMGAGFGYSTAWFARAVRENGGGQVVHTVWDDDLSREAREHLEALGLAELVRFQVSESVQALRRAEGPFDLIFCDIDKEGYARALPAIESRLRVGGVLIVDNALWHGRVFDPTDRSPSTEGVRELTRRLTEDPTWSTSLVPIRDGLFVALRIAGGPPGG
jgi:caffeoyl-CoA O-methyltransferase